MASILHDTFDIAYERITPEARLHDDLDIDSIDAIDLVVQLKALLGKRMNQDAFRAVHTVDDVVAAVDRLFNGGASA